MEKTTIEISGLAKENLLPDESVLWGGASQEFLLMNAANKKSLMLRWILCAVGFVVFLAVYLLLSTKTGKHSIGLIAVMTLAFVYVALVPVFDRNKILKKVKYYVTDRRVMVAVGNREVYTLGKSGLKVKAIPAEGDSVHLLFGAATELPEKKLMIKTFVPLRSESSNEINGLVFYNVTKAPELQAFF